MENLNVIRIDPLQLHTGLNNVEEILLHFFFFSYVQLACSYSLVKRLTSQTTGGGKRSAGKCCREVLQLKVIVSIVNT